MTVLVVDSQHDKEDLMKDMATKLGLSLVCAKHKYYEYSFTDDDSHKEAMYNANSKIYADSEVQRLPFESKTQKEDSDDIVQIINGGKAPVKVLITDEVEVMGEVELVDETEVTNEVELTDDIELMGEVELADEVEVTDEVELTDGIKFTAEVELKDKVKLIDDIELTDNGELTNGAKLSYEGYDFIFGSQAINDEEDKEYFRISMQRAIGYKRVFLTGKCDIEIYDVNISRMDEYIRFSDECMKKAGIENQTAKVILSVIKSDEAINEIMNNLKFECMGLSEIRKDGKLSGFINANLKGDKVVFGYYIHPDFRNQGIATLVVRQMMKFLSEVFDVNCFEAIAEENNEAAKRVISKVGL